MEEKCPLCGAPMEDEQCGYCGHKMKRAHTQGNPDAALMQEETQNIQFHQNINVNMNINDEALCSVSRKNRTVALLLAIFLGGIGAHRFYVGKGGTGILYLLTSGLFGIGWIADIILIATGRFQDEFGFPLR